MSLEKLPNEVVNLIADHLEDDIQALRSLSLCSSRFQGFGETVLFRNILLRTGSQCTSLLRSFKGREQRVQAIHHLDAFCKYKCETGYDAISTILRMATNLRELSMESPCCNSERWRTDLEWKDLMEHMLQPLIEAATHDSCTSGALSPLQGLKKLTLHLNGDQTRYWTIEHSIGALFAHPTLEELTLSCTSVPDHALDDFKHYKKTPLRQLTLIECNVTCDGLNSMLSMPLALKSLSMSENRYHFFTNIISSAKIASKTPVKFLAAIDQQRKSLESIQYSPQECDNPPALDLSSAGELSEEFENLKHVALYGHCPKFLGLFLGDFDKAPNLETVQVRLSDLELNSLGAIPHEDDKQITSAFLRSQLRRICDHVKKFRSLESFTVVTARTCVDPSCDGLTDLKFKLFIESVSEAFDPKRVRFVVVRENRFHYIPPYLYGERPPSQTVVYDTHHEGWKIGFGDDEDDGILCSLPAYETEHCYSDEGEQYGLFD